MTSFTAPTGTPLHLAMYGTPGAPRLVVLHGGPGAHHDYLLPQMLRLAERREAVFYDQRGGGRSRTEDRTPLGWRTHVEDLAAVLHELGEERPSIVGYSWGALLALLYLREVLDHTLDAPLPRRLVLLDPAPVAKRWRSEFEAEFARRQNRPVVRAMRDALAESGLRERDPEAYRKRAFELSVAGYFTDPERARELTPFRVTGRVQQEVWESLRDYDLARDLATLAPRVPALVVHGRDDPIPLESSQAIARAIGGKLVVLEGSGHVPYVEQPDALFGAIERFLAETEGTGG